MELLTSPWVIITIIMAFLIGNIAAFKYVSPKHIEKLKPKNNELDRLIELDKKHQQQSTAHSDSSSHRSSEIKKGE